MPINQQMRAFVIVGALAALAHYSLLIGLVEFAGWHPVASTLVGYVAGGLVSYDLNRRHTFDSHRPHAEAGWRFGLVAGVGFGLTWLLMQGFVGGLHAPYVPAQLLTTGLVLGWSFTANKFWTFGSS